MAAIYGFDDVGNHANMLLDVARVDAFARAIKESVRPDDIVVDVGAGSGVLAILAAQAGARRVLAVERGPMADLIREATKENGVADRVEVLRVDARDLAFKPGEAPTLIVSETIGSFGIDEELLALMKIVRAKCAPNCRVLPERLDIVIALAALPELTRELDFLGTGLPVKLGGLRQRLSQRVALTPIGRAHFVTDEHTACTLTVGVDAAPTVINARLSVTHGRDAPGAPPAAISCIVGGFAAQLSQSVALRSSFGGALPSWANIVFPIDPPLAVSHGDVVDVEIRPRLLTDRGTWAWSARRGDDVRRGDAMRSLVGGRDDMMKQLGIVAPATIDPTQSATLSTWAAALGGAAADVDAMSARLRARFPERYADEEDARRDVLAMLRAAERPE